MLKEQGGKQINSALMGEHHLCCVLVEAGSCVTKSTWLCTACILRHTKGAKSDYKINKACCSGIPYLRGCLSWQPECLNAELVCGIKEILKTHITFLYPHADTSNATVSDVIRGFGKTSCVHRRLLHSACAAAVTTPAVLQLSSFLQPQQREGRKALQDQAGGRSLGGGLLRKGLGPFCWRNSCPVVWTR